MYSYDDAPASMMVYVMMTNVPAAVVSAIWFVFLVVSLLHRLAWPLLWRSPVRPAETGGFSPTQERYLSYRGDAIGIASVRNWEELEQWSTTRTSVVF
jgi:hypothetical protein